MSRGSKQHQHNQQQHLHQSGSASPTTATNLNSAQHARRGNRTLGWYLGSMMPEENSSRSAATDQTGKENASQGMVNADEQSRKGSLADTTSGLAADARTSPKIQHGSRYRQQMTVANGSGRRSRASSSVTASVNKKLDTITNQHQSSFGKEQQQGQQQIELHRMGGGGGRPFSGKENYWYYDPVSDGYYYEHNGTRGWRKKNAKLDAAVQAAQIKAMEDMQQKMMEQQKKMTAATAESKGTNIATVPSLLSTQQLSKFVPSNSPNALLSAPMAIKYFDNDGYFYEMASVDGWRRRQPGTTGSTPPNSLSSSLGGNQTKAPSPVPIGTKLRRKPLQYQAYQQPPPQLKTLGLQEMILLAKQQQQHHHQQQQQQSTCCCSNVSQTTNLATPCCCTIAAMAAQFILQKHQQIIGINVPKGDIGSTEEMPKTKSTECMRSLLEGLSVSKPVAANEQQHLFLSDSGTNIAEKTVLSQTPNFVTESQSQEAVDNAANWQFSRSKWNGFGTAASTIMPTEEKSTSLTIGSFEEPYEFYWSGDEANSEAPTIANKSSLSTVAHQSDSDVIVEGIVNASSTTAASVSSVDDDGLEEMMFGADSFQHKRESTTIAPIGSEAMRKGEEEKRQQLKRPESLKLACSRPVLATDYEPMSPGEILENLTDNAETARDVGITGKQKQFNNMPLQPHNFDVDKFIADLPPMPFDHERILYSLRNPLRTPMGPPPTEPLRTADSPLFTPIYLGKNPWGYMPQENPWAYP